MNKEIIKGAKKEKQKEKKKNIKINIENSPLIKPKIKYKQDNISAEKGSNFDI